MYIERLLKDIGILGEVVKNNIYIDNIELHIEVVKSKQYMSTCEYKIEALSDILIKNIDKIYAIRLSQGEKVNMLFELRLIEAIKNGREEEFASSLYNNK